MLINSKNISSFNATLIEREFTNHEVVSVNDWLDGAPSPVFLREYERYKNITLKFLIEAATEQIMIDKIGALVQELKRGVVKFSDLSYFYDTHMEGVADIKKMTLKAYTVTVNLLAHRTYLPEVTYSKTSSSWAKVTSAAEIASPIHITIRPTANLPTLSISGGTKKAIVLKNMIANVDHIIDGYTGRYLKAGANDIKNYDSFEFPMMQPGVNNFDFNAANFTVTFKYFPHFN